MTFSNTIFSVFSFLGFLFCVIPFTWHLKHQNTGTCLFMAWSGTSCLYQFVNSVLWNGNIVDWSPVWCDICTRIYIASGVGIPASSLCIFRRLHSISTAQRTTPTANKSERRRRVMIDLALGLGLPLLEIILGMVHPLQKKEFLLTDRVASVTQSNRYDIYEDIGCTEAIFNTPVAIIVLGIPPILIGLVTARYAVLTIIAFNRRRLEFNHLLAQHSNLTANFYVRLMCFGGLEVLWTVPVASYFLYSNTVNPAAIHPWTSWAEVHSQISSVYFTPRSIWDSNPRLRTNLELGRWLGVICAFLVFAFFGFAEEARMNYRAAYLTMAKYIGLPTTFSKTPGSSQQTGKRNDIESLVFAHTTTTNISVSKPDDEEDKKEGETLQVDIASTNDSLNAEVNNCDLYPIIPILPEPAVTRS
ncbi:hypothetical protein GALMADRAFT_74260 [Galerina marginata CBS 339.88]|uniref:Uncharacterized protein n=1 Tax=Galerina marginata (strain CBS 339.88) TaxID=685588 RepID=A0A067SMC7_GALM3|nr:hypothetical protein GALMADRAFT_74260 [Galerina marginata CBS 339.88]